MTAAAEPVPRLVQKLWPSLTRLDLDWQRQVSPSFVVEAARHWSLLEELTFRLTKGPAAAKALRFVIASLPRLRVLHASIDSDAAAALDAGDAVPSVEGKSFVSRLQEAVLPHVELGALLHGLQFPQLEELILNDIYPDNSIAGAVLPSLPSLRSFATWVPVLWSECDWAPHAKRLSRVVIRSRISDAEALRMVAALPCLRTLTLHQPAGLTEAFLMDLALTGHPALESLHYYSAGMTYVRIRKLLASLPMVSTRIPTR